MFWGFCEGIYRWGWTHKKLCPASHWQRSTAGRSQKEIGGNHCPFEIEQGCISLVSSLSTLQSSCFQNAASTLFHFIKHWISLIPFSLCRVFSWIYVVYIPSFHFNFQLLLLLLKVYQRRTRTAIQRKERKRQNVMNQTALSLTVPVTVTFIQL